MALAEVALPPPETRRRGLGVVFWLSAAWIALLVVGAVFADVLPIRDPEERGIRTGEVARFETPGWNAFFGADGQGRDLFANVVHGARPALLLGVIVTVLAATIGGLVGVIAGYVRGRIDTVMMTAVDAALAFPGLVFLLAVTAIWGNDLWILIVIFAILGVPGYARIVRGATLAVAERDFVEAARSMGASRVRIVVREIVPNVTMAVLSFAFIGFAVVIAAEGALAFLGLSLDETTWGSLIADGQVAIREASHLALIPATVMFLTILAFNYVGDGIRQIAEPRTAPSRSQPRYSRPRRDTTPPASDALLSIRGLRTQLGTPAGAVTAVDDVSLDLHTGQVLGIVGESGCGKTMLLRSILGTFPIADVTRTGRVAFDGVDLLEAHDVTRRRLLGTEIGVVSQNPLSALSPVRTVGSQVTEPMRVHRGISRARAAARAVELLAEVGIPEPARRLRQYPHELSGGMQQRVTIAIALANEPRLLLADEPTTALDVTIQDQILLLLASLCRDRHMALMLVTHDLAVVRGWTDRVAVMYAGRIVEEGPTPAIFAEPRHRYTEALLESIPHLDRPSHSELAVIDGQPPALIDLPPGCRFAPRCDHADDRCRSVDPPAEYEPLGRLGTGGHGYACWHPAGSEEPRGPVGAEHPPTTLADGGGS